MKKLEIAIASLLMIFVFTKNSFAQDTLVNILSDELSREMNELKSQPISPYYMEYRVDDIKSLVINASFGSLVDQDENDGRVLTSIVKVGDYNYDNTHEVKGTDVGGSDQPFAMRIPLENGELAVKQALWQATHYAYRNAVDALSQVKSVTKDEVKKNAPDFSQEKPAVYIEPAVDNRLKNKDEWIKKLKDYSKPFLADEKVISADAILSYMCYRKYFVNSEGSKIVQNFSYAQLQILTVTKADDGSVLPLFRSFYAYTPDRLPSHEAISKEIKNMLAELKAVRTAPDADPYTGPAILSPSAAAVFFHEIFGHRIEGHRMKSDFDSQTFKAKVGDMVLPNYMSIISDPTMSSFKGNDMYGFYKYDDQGVQAQKVAVVNKGKLENFLMSRAPLENFTKSNGHGRSQAGMAAVSRQSNLIVETDKPLSAKELRKKLIAECKKQNLKYGYLFDQVFGGFTMTTRYSPNVFNVKPTVVYKIYVDGRPDEMVRGVNFIGTPLAIFSEVGATSDSTGMFTGYCGAESGSIPVTAISPSLLIKKIETQKQPENYGQMPILPRPDIEKIKKENK